MNESIQEIAALLCQSSTANKRSLIAIAGPPGAGKSTFAQALAPEINQLAGSDKATILPMDGYHLDNSILEQQHSLTRKGAPHTFDVHGFINMVKRITTSTSEIVVPVFDRQLDLARAGARSILASHTIILIEGNYLLLDQQPWSDLHPLFDYRIYLDVPEPELHKRLTQRWIAHNHSPEEAIARAESNDLPNARLVTSCRLSADRIISSH